MTFSSARSCLDVIANDSSPDCGISREVESGKRRFRSRIVGGGDVSEGEIPWQVGFDFFKFCHSGAGHMTLTDLRFVKKFTHPDFRAKNFTH